MFGAHPAGTKCVFFVDELDGNDRVAGPRRACFADALRFGQYIRHNPVCLLAYEA